MNHPVPLRHRPTQSRGAFSGVRESKSRIETKWRSTTIVRESDCPHEAVVLP